VGSPGWRGSPKQVRAPGPGPAPTRPQIAGILPLIMWLCELGCRVSCFLGRSGQLADSWQRVLPSSWALRVANVLDLATRPPRGAQETGGGVLTGRLPLLLCATLFCLRGLRRPVTPAGSTKIAIHTKVHRKAYSGPCASVPVLQCSNAVQAVKERESVSRVSGGAPNGQLHPQRQRRQRGHLSVDLSAAGTFSGGSASAPRRARASAGTWGLKRPGGSKDLRAQKTDT
jgi:hypothetical protein